jgi:hypothetical protein
MASFKLLKHAYARVRSAYKPIQIIISFAIIILAGLIFLWIANEILILSISRSYVQQIAVAFDLNRHLAEAISLAVFVILAFFASRLISRSRLSRRVGYIGITGLLIVNSIVLWLGTRDQFFETSGVATKCYVLNRDGVRFAERPGIDAATGKQCKPVTADMLERLQQYAKGKRPQRIPDGEEPVFFDLKTGEPNVWFAKTQDGEIELYDLMGFHPTTGEELIPINRETVQQWTTQQKALAERAPRRINPDNFVFFDAKSGKPRAWYWRSPDGQLEFYDNKGFQPRTGDPLEIVTRDVVTAFTEQSAKKCYVVTRETVVFGTTPGPDPKNGGRECRLFTPALLERLQDYQRGNRPKRVTVTEPIFFDLRTGEANLWYAKNDKGEIQLFDLMGFHPETGQELLPVNTEIVSAWKKQSEVVARKAPQAIDPDKFSFFDRLTGEPRVWYWRGPNGEWEFYDNPGFRSTGEKLALISREIVDAWKKEAGTRAKRAAEETAQKEQERIAAIESAQREQQAGPLCDRQAANPTDFNKPQNITGVEYAELKLGSQSAAEVCSIAVSKYPAELRYKYNLARALEFSNVTKSKAIYEDLIRQHYIAAYDNYAGILYRADKNLPEAIRYYDLGARAGDPGAMVSVAWLIQKNLYRQVPDANNLRIALLKRAADAGHRGAQDTLRQEEAALQTQALEQQKQLMQQQMMMQFFGGVLGAVRR